MEIITSLPNQPEAQTSPLNQPALRPPRSHWLLLLVWLGIFSWGYVQVGQPLLQVNTLLGASEHEFQVLQATGEQAQLLHPAEPLLLSQSYYQWFPHATAANVPPLYPWLLAHTADAAGKLPIMPELYRQGQRANLWIGLGFLLLLGCWLWKNGSLLVAANAMLLLGFGVFLPHAVFYEPTVLFFGLYGLAFAFGLQLLTRNGAWPHVGFGLVVGAAYLTDVTILPLVLSWAVVTSLRFLFELCRRETHRAWNCPGHFIGLLGLSIAFLAVVGPNLQFHHERHHTWQPLTQEYLRVETTQSSGTQKISLAEYWSTHNWGQEIMPQLQAKLRALVFPAALNATAPEGTLRLLTWRGAYIWGLLVIFFIAAIHARTRGPAWFQDGPAADSRAGARVSFLLLTVALGLVAAALYHGLDGSENTILHLYPCLVLGLVLGAESLRQWAERRGRGGRAYSVIYRLAHVVLLAHLIYSVVAFLPKQA